MDATMEFFSAHAGALYIYDADKDELYFAAARGPKAKEVLALDITIKPGQGIAGSCFQNNEVIAVSDAHKDPRFSRAVSDAVGYQVQSMLTTPIVCDGQPLGALQVINKKGGHVFSGEEVELARQLGQLAGGLIGLGCEVDELRRAAGVS
jgi:sigma-B regulation protein RsbU (phosphoserine phosphatase)